MVFGVVGSNGAICGSIKFKMVAGGHLGMMALSRVTLASAGLSCLSRKRVVVQNVCTPPQTIGLMDLHVAAGGYT